MNILAFDTALGHCSVALKLTNGQILIDHQANTVKTDVLVSHVKELILQAGISFHDLHLIATTFGPGSFTGLRSGLAAAQGYALSTGLPLIGFSTLEMLACGVEDGEVPIVVIINSKRGDYYFQIFDSQKNPLTQPAILRLDNALELISDPSIAVVCSDADEVLALLTTHRKVVKCEPVNASILLELAEKKYAQGFSGHPNLCKPVYVREADAHAPKASDICLVNA